MYLAISITLNKMPNIYPLIEDSNFMRHKTFYTLISISEPERWLGSYGTGLVVRRSQVQGPWPLKTKKPQSSSIPLSGLLILFLYLDV
jgi:hypothetical protein